MALSSFLFRANVELTWGRFLEKMPHAMALLKILPVLATEKKPFLAAR